MSKQTRILIVDDEKMNRDLLADLLKPFYKIMVAKNGKQALKVAARAEGQPDLILLDIMMPEMDGYEVCRRLKTDAATRDIPVIFVTAMGEESDERMGFALGAVDYITKPVSPPIVQARVGTHLKLRQMQLELEEKNQTLEKVAELRDDVEHIVRHDLKSPINAIITAPRLLAGKYPYSEDDLQLLEIIEQAGHKMLNMINNSLDLYKMETDTYSLVAQPIDLLEILRTVLKEVLASSVAQGKQTVLRLQGKEVKEQDEFFARGEAMLCYPMFSNLLLNAFEATPAGATVTIDLESESGNPHVSIKITNQGTVPVSIRDRFFAKYITKGKKSGTGLGTYSAMLCAKTQQGEITLECLPDDRTRIIVSLPVVKT